MSIRTATAIWKGNLKEGEGIITTQSGVLKDVSYSFATRFEEAKGTNPEELIAAAHSACFSMALSGALQKAGHVLQEVYTEDKIHLDKTEDGFKITKLEVFAQAVVPGIQQAEFLEIAEGAKKNCPVSQALKSIEIVLVARLKS